MIALLYFIGGAGIAVALLGAIRITQIIRAELERQRAAAAYADAMADAMAAGAMTQLGHAEELQA